MLSHFDDSGAARMVDVGQKPVTERVARASARVRMLPETLALLRDRRASKKGDVIEVARLAGIMAAKRTGELIPLCHPLPLDSVGIDFAFPTADPGDVMARTPGRAISTSESRHVDIGATVRPAVDESAGSGDPRTTQAGSGDPRTTLAGTGDLRTTLAVLAIEATVRTTARTGVEMEALTAVTVAALTVYDMCKSVDRGMVIEQIQLEEKSGGKSGHFVRTARICG
jgi:cyclic pyranopterin phosphate synthase